MLVDELSAAIVAGKEFEVRRLCRKITATWEPKKSRNFEVSHVNWMRVRRGDPVYDHRKNAPILIGLDLHDTGDGTIHT